MNNLEKKSELGVGLIGIGRKWGHKESAVPSEEQALAYLSYANQLGITFFDTAPAYGLSEERLGRFVKTLSEKQRDRIIIATKFGEHWDIQKETPYTDHSFAALKQSIDQSLKRLGKIDILQIHKTSPEVLKNPDLLKAIMYAKEKGIMHFGASVSDRESATIVCEKDIFSSIQIPFNESNQQFVEIIEKAHKKGKTIIVNRPFNMGAMLYDKKNQPSPEEQKIHAYQFILKKLKTNGVILTGTKSPEHLKENFDAFNESLANLHVS